MSIYSNSFLVVIKLIAGIMMGSVSIISEAIHSLIDLLAAVIANYSVRESSKPPDNGHPYGHGKYENYAGVIEAILILIAAGLIVYESFKRLFDGKEVEMLTIGIFIMALSAVINYGVSRKLYNVGREEDSMALVADGLHLRTDVMTSVGVFIGLVLMQLTGWQILDPIVGLLVAVMIVKAAYDLTKEASQGLVDAQLPEQDLKVIEDILAKYNGRSLSYRSLRTRKAGPERFIDLTLELDGDLSLNHVHEVCDMLEIEIKNRLPACDITIHCEPSHPKTDASDKTAPR